MSSNVEERGPRAARAATPRAKSKGSSKTLWLNGAAALVGAIATVAPESPIVAALPSGPAILTLLGALNYWLRHVTSQPLKD